MPTFVTQDGVSIAFSDEGAGAPVVLVPGICCSRNWWSRQAALTERFRVVSPDLRGVGRSERVRHGHRISRYGADLAELLEQLDLREVVLVGWSMGCSVALAMVELVGQERLAGLVLVEGSPRLLNDLVWAYGVADLDEGLRMRAALRDDWDAVSEALIRDMFSLPGRDPNADDLLADLRDVDPDSVARLFWDHLNQDWRDVLPTIAVPTLVLAGGASKIGDSVGAATYLKTAIPDARLSVFEIAGHALFREQPDRFNSMLADFAHVCVGHHR
ncbi:alpha/beta fold hydrolase [Flindersiella endophytica]